MSAGAQRAIVDRLPAPIRAIVVNASSLVGATAATSALGAVYWWLAAREFSQQAVGIASSAISTMTLLATLTSLGLGTFLMGELPARPANGRALLVVACATAGGSAALLGVMFAFAAPVLSSDLDSLAGPGPALLFALGAALTAVAFVLDKALIGLFRGGIQLARNVVFGVAKLAVLFVAALLVAGESGLDIYATWTAGLIVSFVALLPWVTGRDRTAAINPRSWPRSTSAVMGSVWRAVLGHQALNLALRLPILALPVLAVAMISAVANANFYIAWMIVNLAFVIPGSLATVLYAAGAADPGAVAEKIRMTLRLSTMTTVAAMVALLAAAEPLLRVFGESYADDGLDVLRIMALVGIPMLIKNHYVAVVRIQRRVRAALPLVWLGAALELGLAAGGAAIGGLEGLGVGWVTAVWIQALFMVAPVRASMLA